MQACFRVILTVFNQHGTDICNSRNFIIVKKTCQSLSDSFLPEIELLLDSEELQWIQTRYPNKRFANHSVVLAVTLKYFQIRKFYPSYHDKPPQRLIDCLATQLGYPDNTLKGFNWHYNNKTLQRFRTLIRKKLHFRRVTSADNLQFINWFKTQIVKNAPTPIQSASHAESYFLQHHIELPTSERLKRHIQSAHTQFEEEFFTKIALLLTDATKIALDRLLQDEQSLSRDITAPYSSRLYCLKESLRKINPETISEFILKFESLKCIILPISQFKTYQRKLLLKYHQRIMVETPGEIQAHPDMLRYGMLAIFCYIQQQHMTDILTQVLIDATHKIKVKAETKIKKDIISEVTCVNGKFDILYQLAELAANAPHGIIEKTIYPAVTQDTLRILAKELKYRGRWYKQTVKIKMHSLYSHYHRRLLLPILKALTFHAQHTDYQPIINAIEFVLVHSESTKKRIPLTKQVPLDGVMQKSWKTLVVDTNDKSNKSFINRFHYEIAVYETLREKLDCKSVWVEGAYRYRNPDEDLPQDFYTNRRHYFTLLHLPAAADIYVDDLKQRMCHHLNELNQGLPNNKKVKVIIKDGKPWIKITTSDPQVLPEHIDILKTDISKRWSTLNLLDIFKETAIRTQFMQHFHTICDHEILKPETLWKRLLLCLYGIGTNAGMKRISSGNHDVTYNDLRYIKRRFITACRIRAAIVEVVNQTLVLRDPIIWGEGNTTVACDSKKIDVWDQNLMSQWHARYKDSGVMIYWHVDQKSLCVYSQLKTCLSSEIASMMQGVLHHDTNMDIKEATMDSHGQSLPGFGFSDLLHVNLLPRIKGIQREKLYPPDEFCVKSYPQLKDIMSSPINWRLIHYNYEELVRNTAALRLGTVDSDIILKRFKSTNYKHPVYKALIELGKAIKTIFLCRYLHSEKLRIDINASQNVVERVNGFMDFIFYGKLGEISTNKTQDQELAILCLHLLQASLVYINTLLIQKVLSAPTWGHILTANDKRALTPLIHGHINPYGLFPLDMNTRIEIGL